MNDFLLSVLHGIIKKEFQIIGVFDRKAAHNRTIELQLNTRDKK